MIFDRQTKYGETYYEIRDKENLEESIKRSRHAIGDVDRQVGRVGYSVNEPRGENLHGNRTSRGSHRDVYADGGSFRGGNLHQKTVGRDRGGLSTVALSITDKLVRYGWIDLRGQKINSPEDIAALAAVYRSPQFETLRFYVVRAGKIVCHWGLTSRLAGRVGFRGKGQSNLIRSARDLTDRMNRTGADSYYISHNHPSGNPLSSNADERFSKAFSETVKGFAGHVVTNGKSFL